MRLRLTALLVSIERVWWVSHSLIASSSALDNIRMTKHISQTCARRSCRPARYLPSSTHSHIPERCLATALRASSSITTGHYVLNKAMDPKRLGSENNALKEHNKLARNDTAGIVLQQHSQYSTLYTEYLFLMKRLVCVCRRSVVFLGSWLKEK